VIQGHSLLPVLHAFLVAKQTVSNIKENLMFSLFYNLVVAFITSGFLLPLGVVLNPSVGAALMIIQTSLILLNVYRFAKHQDCAQSMISTAQTHSNGKKLVPNVMSLLSESPKPLVQLEKREEVNQTLVLSGANQDKLRREQSNLSPMTLRHRP